MIEEGGFRALQELGRAGAACVSGSASCDAVLAPSEPWKQRARRTVN